MAALHSLKGDEVILGFRFEAALVAAAGPLTAQVYTNELYGAHTMLHLSLQDEAGTIVHARSGRGVEYPIGTPVRFDLNHEMVRFFDPQTTMALSVPA